MTNVTRALILLIGLTACGDSAVCIGDLCPLSVAVNLKLTSAATGAPIDSGRVAFSLGGTQSTILIPCDSACILSGDPGSYTIHVTAPGFASAERTVNVSGTNPECGCAVADTQDVTIALVAAN